jgi:2-oxoglutarate dehydrogenase E2 component (dihydrolipoamide succinyltransferase)
VAKEQAPKKAAPEQAPQKPASAAAPARGEREERAARMSPLRRRVAERLVAAQQNAALLTTFNDVDMSEVIAIRKEYRDDFLKKYEVKLGFMSLFVKAAVQALELYPHINSEIRDDHMIERDYYDIGIAVGGGKGLVVPVLRDAQKLSIAEIELAIADFASRAQKNAITIEELQGGTFSITNGGVFGSLLSTPIINPPQSGILGMHRIEDRPVAVNGEVVIRPMMYLALTYDHRIVDGREAVSFLKTVKERIEAPARLLLEA